MVQVKLTASYVSRADLRRAAIHLLQSMLALPLHFANMPIKVPSQPTGTRYHLSTNNAILWFGSTGYKKRPDYLATFCLYRIPTCALPAQSSGFVSVVLPPGFGSA